MDLNRIKRIHIIGVGGTLMGNFAIMMKRRGFKVSGSDQTVYPPMCDRLSEENIDVFEGYSEKNLRDLDAKTDLIVVGNVIQKINPEARAAESSKIPMTSLPEFMGKYFLKETENIIIAGTHGKTTTASMMSFVFRELKKDLSFFIGGVVPDLEQSFCINEFPPRGFFILEGDEYDTVYWDKVPKFNHYYPNQVVLTSIEFDHADIYSDMDAVRKAFDGLIERIRFKGKLIYRYDDLEIRDLIERSQPILQKNQIELFSFGRDRRCDFQYRNLELHPQTQFDIIFRDYQILQIKMKLSGEYNVHNALSCCAIAFLNQFDLKKVESAFEVFRGVKRRQEVRGHINGALVIDDFAHHPTAVQETLKALKMKYPKSKLLVAFEPRSATSRRKIFQERYSQSFDYVDHAWIAKPYDQSKMDSRDCFSSEELVDAIQKRGKSAELLKSGEDRIRQIYSKLGKDSVLAVLSNGSFDDLISKLLHVPNSGTQCSKE